MDQKPKKSGEEKVKKNSNDRIKEFEKELSTTKYNKRTQGAIGLLKAKIARLKEDQEKKSSGGKKGEGYSVRRTGDATVILVGFPSTGKSTLLNKLTNANSIVGAYDFTTLTVIPGLMEYRYAKIQVLDVPGIVRGAAAGTGRGKEVLACVRSADLAILIVEVNHPEHLNAIQRELYEFKIRTNQRRPDVKIVKTSKDGIKIGATLRLTKLDEATIKNVLREFSYTNANVVIREDIDVDQLIDCIEDNRKYIPGLIVLTKIDTVSEDRLNEIVKIVNPDIAVSAETNINIEALKEGIYNSLGFISIYTKEVGKEADMGVPLIMQKPCHVRDVCHKLHKDFVAKFKFARIFGRSAKFPGQRLGLDHQLLDKDIVEVHIK